MGFHLINFVELIGVLVLEAIRSNLAAFIAEGDLADEIKWADACDDILWRLADVRKCKNFLACFSISFEQS